MTQTTVHIESYLEENAQRFQDDLIQWLKIPSVSTDSAYSDDVKAAAGWLANRLQQLGFATEQIETSGHPIVYAESPKVEGAPTILVYGHYDVQPPDPLDQWISPPFEPAIRDGNVYARGATDDKGQFLTHLFSCEAWLKTEGKLPVQIKFLVEGEEECGSGGLYELLSGKYDEAAIPVAERLKCDICVISDSSQYAPSQPAITYGLKGIAYFELNLSGPNQDLHSGGFGGTVSNPANILSRMLSSLYGENGQVQIPGFYDDVVGLTAEERQEFADLNFDDQSYMKQLGVNGLSGEQGFTTLERRWARPTFDINGMWGGYQGQGAKTIIPAKAGAKFSFRLVPNQDPKKIAQLLEQTLQKQLPEGLEMELRQIHGAPGVLVDPHNPFMDAAARAIEKGFGTRPVLIRCGGSIPVVNAFKNQMGVDTILMGWGQDDDNTHSPNEKFNLKDFQRGIRSSAYLWEEIAKMPQS